ncbi:MAG: glycosyltransferase family 2 protein [Bacteroidaceae bacterium]|nr:glycosyltransferase family 2 protein [Bacteroidaceae bacterium]
MKLDLTTIILTYNEEIHIRRALENVCPLSQKVIVVDSPSTDRTQEICREFDNVEVVVHAYPGNQAEQFNWALDHCAIDTEWVLRLDADEYLYPELVVELEEKLPQLPKSVSALSLSRARCFMGRRLRHGIVNSVRLVRLFRKGMARSEQRLMDEQIAVLGGEVVEMEHQFVDDNRLPIGAFVRKHDNYASREAALLLCKEYGLGADSVTQGASLSKAGGAKRSQKDLYARMPLFWRALAYFVYRYVVKLGFLDGKEGFCWDFFQGLWYRMLVDCKVYEAKKACGSDAEKIKEYLLAHYNIKV